MTPMVAGLPPDVQNEVTHSFTQSVKFFGSCGYLIFSFCATTAREENPFSKSPWRSI